MGSFGGFYKGEKKKAKKEKKGDTTASVINKPVFILPKKIEKKRREE